MGDLGPLRVGEVGSWVPDERRKEVDRIRDCRLSEGWRLCRGFGGASDGSTVSSGFSSVEGVGDSLLAALLVSGDGAGGSGSAVLEPPAGSSFAVEASSFFFCPPPFLLFSFCFLSCSNCKGCQIRHA